MTEGRGGTSVGDLAGIRILVPRAEAQATALSRAILDAGGQPVEAPVLLIEPGEVSALERAVRSLAKGEFQVICFTSPNGVNGVATALKGSWLDASAVRKASIIACVGPGTAKALHDELGLEPDVMPQTATTAALGEVITPGSGRALLPRADIASPVLPKMLVSKGYTPVEVVAYRTVCPPSLPAKVLSQLRDGQIDLIAVASPSTARNLLRLLGEDLQRAGIVSIGPVTTAACHDLGLEVVVEADPHTLDGLVDALHRGAAAL